MMNKQRDTGTDTSPPSPCGERHPFVTSKGRPLISAASLRGLPVRNQDNQNLGILKELMIETDRGTVAYGVLLFEDDKSFAIPYNAMTIDPEGMTIYVQLQREVLESGAGIMELNDDDIPEEHK